jgi:hypothetical protein
VFSTALPACVQVDWHVARCEAVGGGWWRALWAHSVMCQTRATGSQEFHRGQLCYGHVSVFARLSCTVDVLKTSRRGPSGDLQH